MASNSFYAWIFDLFNDNLTGQTLKLLLVNATDTADKVLDEFVADIVANELSDGSYSRKTLASITLQQNQDSHGFKLDAADPVFTALAGGETVNAAYVFRQVTNDADSYLVARLDGSNITTNGGNVTVQFHATDGILYADG